MTEYDQPVFLWEVNLGYLLNKRLGKSDVNINELQQNEMVFARTAGLISCDNCYQSNIDQDEALFRN